MAETLVSMKNLVLAEHPLFIVDMMYARDDNIVGRAVYKEIGFGNKAYVHKDVWKALLKIVPYLEKSNLKLRICDAYRPPLAHMKLLESVPMKGLFAQSAEKSNHCHGTAIDVCLTDINGKNLIYPTQIDAYEKCFQEQICSGDFDEFGIHLQKARHDYMQASAEEIANRNILKNIMENIGFEAIPHEWWHYNLKNWKNYPLINW